MISFDLENVTTSPPSEHVVIIVVDGLRVDTSLNLNSFNSLRSLGNSFVSTTGLPSLSLPGITTICTGALPEISGVTTNWYTGVSPDSIFDRAKEANFNTAIVGNYGSFFGKSVDTELKVDESQGSYDEQICEISIKHLKDAEPNLVLIHFASLDNAGHKYGGRSKEYVNVSLLIDSYITRIMSSLDLNKWTIILTSDHGHIDTGGHGGTEPEATLTPLVIGGRGIEKSQSDVVSQAVIAPTVSVLLGLPPPMLSQYDPLFQVISIPYRKYAEDLNKFQKEQYYSLFAKIFGVPDLRIEDLTKYNITLVQLANSLREKKTFEETYFKLPILISGLILPLLFYYFRRRDTQIILAPSILLILYVSFVSPLPNKPLSISIFNSVDEAILFFLASITQTVTLFFITMFLAQLIKSRNVTDRKDITFTSATELALNFLCFALIPCYFYLTTNPVVLSWSLPNIQQGFKFYMLMTDIGVIGFCSIPIQYIIKSIIISRHKFKQREMDNSVVL